MKKVENIEKCAALEEVLDKTLIGNWDKASKLFRELQYTLNLNEFDNQLENCTNEELKDICRIGYIALSKEMD